jgi:hypothetical protein
MRSGGRTMRWAFWCACLALAVTPTLTACVPASAASAGSAAPAATQRPFRLPTPGATSATTCADISCAARQVHVFVEPQAGEAPIVQGIAGATTSVWVEVCALGNGYP